MKIKHREKRFEVQAYTLMELAGIEGMSYRNAQKRKDLFAAVIIPYGKPDKEGNRRVHVRYLDKETTQKITD